MTALGIHLPLTTFIPPKGSPNLSHDTNKTIPSTFSSPKHCLCSPHTCPDSDPPYFCAYAACALTPWTAEGSEICDRRGMGRGMRRKRRSSHQLISYTEDNMRRKVDAANSRLWSSDKGLKANTRKAFSQYLSSCTHTHTHAHTPEEGGQASAPCRWAPCLLPLCAE